MKLSHFYYVFIIGYTLIEYLLCLDTVNLEFSVEESTGMFSCLIGLGNPIQVASFYVDINQYYTVINNFLYTSKLSQSGKKLGYSVIKIDDRFINSTIMNDDVTFIKNKVIDIVTNDYQFYKYKDEDLIIHLLGLGYNKSQKNANFSLIDNLYNQKYISQRSFYIHKINESDGIIYLGELPNEIKEGKYKSTCNIINNKWECPIENVIYDNYNYHEKDSSNTVVFTLNNSMISAPSNFIKFLYKKVFKELITNKTCTYSENMGNNNFYCSCNFVDNFKDLYLIFNGGLQINMKNFQLFYKNGFDNMCLFKIYHDSHYKNKWVVGTSAYSDHNIIGFDYSKRKIISYSTSKLIFINENGKIILYFKINIYLILFVIILNIYVYFFKLNANNNQN